MRSKLLTFTPATRALLAFCALTVFVLAVVATIGSVRERRDDAVRVHEARAYADVARVADRQRFLLASSRRARTTKAAITSLSRMAQESLDDLRTRSSGAEAATAAALTVSYRIASRNAAGSVDGAGGSNAATARQAQLELASIEAKAEAALQERQRSVMEASPSLLLDSFQIVAMVLVGILALFGSTLVLRSGREPQAAQRDIELERLEVEARTDNLTGLGNHRAFHHDLSLEVQRRARTGSVFALMAIDLDGLKQINDSQGHQAGDVYIRRVCEIARAATGREGTVYRTGGDEFMVLLPGSRNWNALALANRIDRRTRAAFGRASAEHRADRVDGDRGAPAADPPGRRRSLRGQAHEADGAHLPPRADRTARSSGDAPSHHQRALAAALARAVDAKDAGTRSHSETVAELCVAIGTVLRLRRRGARAAPPRRAAARRRQDRRPGLRSSTSRRAGSTTSRSR